jgi:hypothetical protein
MVPRNSEFCVSEVLQPICLVYAVCVHGELQIEVKQSLYSPEYARSVPGGGSCQILWKSAMILDGLPALGTGYSYCPGHRTLLLPRKYSWYSFVLRGWIGSRTMWLEGLCQWKVPVTLSGNKPENFGLRNTSTNCTTAYPRILLQTCTASLKLICVKKSCILTNGSRFFVVYHSLKVNAYLLSNVYNSQRPSVAALHHSLQNVHQKRPSQRYLNFVILEFLRDTFQCRHSTTFPCYTLNTLPTTLTSSPTNTLPCVKRTFARRTSGHSL